MSATIPCTPCCTTPQTVNIPGSVGPNGTPGTNGTNGVNAFTFTTANFTTPALSGSVTMTVANSSWMVVGQAIVVADGTADGGTYLVTSVPGSTSVVATYLNYASNTNATVVVNSGAGISPAGLQTGLPVPITVPGGGTDAITSAAARANLGVGQAPLLSNVGPLTQAILSSNAQIAGCGVTIPNAGTWIYMGQAIVDWTATTFAGEVSFQITIVNVSTSVVLSTGTWKTGATGATTIPSTSLVCPFYVDTGVVATNQIQLFVQCLTGVTNSGGTWQVTSASLIAIPVAYTLTP